jgi:hypothetical membrane protein
VTYAAWLAQPAYLVVEVVLALVAGVGYSLRDDTISALGTSCGPAEGGCSSAPLLMNVTFVVTGLLQALGAVPLVRVPGRTSAVGWLWVVAGLASVGVGLLPVDAHPIAHSLVAAPVFAVQPVALLLHARLLRDGPLRRAGLGLGVLALLGVVAFVMRLGADHWSGLAERAAIWPAKLWLPLVLLATASRPRPAGEQPPGPRRGGTAPANPPTAPGR